MSNFINSEENPEIITDDIVRLVNELNLDVNNEDINEFIEFHSIPLSTEYLIEQEELNEIHMESKKEADKTVKAWKIKNLNEAFIHLDKILTIMEECDPNEERIYLTYVVFTKKRTACYKT